VSQSVRCCAEYALRIFVVLEAAQAGAGQRDSAWHFVVALFMLPAVLLAPVNGALSNSLPKRLVLVASSAFCSLVLLFFCYWPHAWLLCVALVALGSAAYSPARLALLPAAAHDTRWPLSRVVAAIETGAVLSMVVGMLLGGKLALQTWPDVASRFAFLHELQTPVAIAAIFLLNVLCLATAFPVWFASDVRRPEAPAAALRGFFRDCRRVFGATATGFPLLALALFRGIVTALSGALIAVVLSAQSEPAQTPFHALMLIAVLVMLGTAMGSFVAGLGKDPARLMILVPLGTTGLCAALAGVGWLGRVPPGLCVAAGFCGGLINVPLLARYQAGVPADARGNGMTVLNTTGYVCMIAMSLVMAGLGRTQVLSALGQVWFVTGLTGACTIAAWRLAARETASAANET
jgi:MFS family permease